MAVILAFSFIHVVGVWGAVCAVLVISLCVVFIKVVWWILKRVTS
jgi:hypothetical protein